MEYVWDVGGSRGRHRHGAREGFEDKDTWESQAALRRKPWKKRRKGAIQSQEPATSRRWIVMRAGVHAQCHGLTRRGRKHTIKR